MGYSTLSFLFYCIHGLLYFGFRRNFELEGVNLGKKIPLKVLARNVTV